MHGAEPSPAHLGFLLVRTTVMCERNLIYSQISAALYAAWMQCCPGMASSAPGATLRPLMKCCRPLHSHASAHNLSFAAVKVLEGTSLAKQILQWSCCCRSRMLKEGIPWVLRAYHAMSGGHTVQIQRSANEAVGMSFSL